MGSFGILSEQNKKKKRKKNYAWVGWTDMVKDIDADRPVADGGSCD